MITKLIDVCEIKYGYAFDSSKFTNDNSYPQLARIRDVKRGYSETFYSGEIPEGYELSKGDLLVGMDGEFNIARWKNDSGLLNQRVCKITAKKDVDEEFIRYFLTKELKKIEERTDAVTVKHLSAKEINKIMLDLPDANMQKKISSTLFNIEKIISSKKKQLELLDELIKARFVEMFGDGKYPQTTIAELVSGKVPSVKKDFSPDDIIKYIDISSIDNKKNVMTGYTEYVVKEAPSRAQQHISKGDIVISTVSTSLSMR